MGCDASPVPIIVFLVVLSLALNGLAVYLWVSGETLAGAVLFTFFAAVIDAAWFIVVFVLIREWHRDRKFIKSLLAEADNNPDKP